ncbi:MAG: 1-deoxy-D-xylulose-5-phosphate reductoisomerase [Chloroflexi bacterium]|nr:1-deoxy-D-xylulose-5-phosphate reductoisomerase [Chloroflexota bacterium]
MNQPPATDAERFSPEGGDTPKGIVVLGSTGSIGTQTLDVIRARPDRFRVIGLAAGTRLDELAEQVREFRPRFVWAPDTAALANVVANFGNGPAIVPMEQMVAEPDVDLVMVATTGRAGLASTLEAMRNGKQVALSNKEIIIMAGRLLTSAAREYGAPMLPVDSEPSAIWQCIQGEAQPVNKLIITASGGPFRKRPIAELATVTAQDALKHPTWAMGKKITIDSSTLMNKGFEVIESHWLFSVPFEQIEVVVHPQSVIHSMVEFADGSVKAQMGPPDMRLPIQYAMSYPERIASNTIPRFDPLKHAELTFEELDVERYPCFATAVEAGRKGQTYPAVLSAADEEAVHLFLAGRIGFNDIHGVVSDVLDKHEPIADASLESILAADAWAREQVSARVAVRR